jgi:hypothetical protein
MSDEPIPPREPHPDVERRPLRERYPGPWRIHETPGSSFGVFCGQRVMAYVYYRTDREGPTPTSLTRAEALAMARAIAGLAGG